MLQMGRTTFLVLHQRRRHARHAAREDTGPKPYDVLTVALKVDEDDLSWNDAMALAKVAGFEG